MPEQHLTLHQLNQNIKEELSQAFPKAFWVVAEISEIRTVNSGHCYLELIEKEEGSDQIKAKARATIWAYTFRILKPYFETTTRQSLTAGLKVLLKVSIEFQEVYGFSLNVKDIDPTFTLGDIARRKMEVIQQLTEEGVMDMNKELELASVPQKLAVISSPTAAGYEDFINQLENNTGNYKIYHKLFPAIMQGDEAEDSIIGALDRIYQYEELFDAVILIRGGGSTADLMCFDNYMLAMNIAQFPLPVLTGIGHERDESVADMVAHTRLKTPTAVAEFIIDRIAQFADYLLDLQDQFTDQTKLLLNSESHRLELAAHRFQPVVSKILSNKRRYPAEAAQRLDFSIKNYFDKQEAFFSHVKESIRYLTKKQLRTSVQQQQFLASQLKLEISGFVKNKKQQIQLSERTIQLSDPKNILKRGYSITTSNQQVIKALENIKIGDEINTLTKNGQIISRVEKLKPLK